MNIFPFFFYKILPKYSPCVNFSKKTLGIKPSTNNCVIYVETDRYALQIDVHVRMIKYWLKLT